MLKQIFIFILLFSFSTSAISQIEELELNKKKKKEIKNLAHEAERSGKYYLAIEYYKKLVELDPKNIENQIHYADLLRYTRNYKEAVIHYQTIFDIDITKYPEALFYLATMQKATGQHKNAMANLEKFKKIVKKTNNPKFKKLLETELQGCKLALAYKDSVPRELVNSVGTQVNNPHIDFSPIPLGDDTIVFGSLRENEEKFYKIDEDNPDTLKLPTRKFYLADKQEGNWKFEGEWKGPFNTEDADIANGTFSLDQKTFYFSKCTENWQYKIICKIYFSKKRGSGWSKPELIESEINLAGYSSSHPTFGRESKKKQEVMYFVSDREGGKGGLDIWYSEYNSKNKSFKSPKNAGNAINSPGTEMTPYYDIKSKTLYFSSDGKPNLGGLDLFKSKGEGNKFSTPVNLGVPLNSYQDDLDFILKPSGKGGFLVSNREGGMSIYNPTCCDDIYEFTYLNYIEISLKGLVMFKGGDPDNDTGISQINIYIKDEEGGGRFLTETIPLKGNDYQLKLKPGLNYEIEVKKDHYYNGVLNLSTKSYNKNDSIKKDVVLEKMSNDAIVIPHINYDFGSDKLTNDSKNTLDTSLVKLLNENPELKIEIRSHTDNKGSDAFNMKLSQGRAESVVRYLYEKGINKKRLIASGYGETLPIAPNSNSDGSDNPEGRAQNRRTEFKIIGNIEETILYDTDEPKEKNIKDKKVKSAEEQ